MGLGKIVMETSGNIGKAYRKNDEVGTPYCITIDFDTIENQLDTITIRDRDTMEQTRMSIDDMIDFIKNKYNGN